MDFLSSLGIENVPEQQTRTSHNSKITKALSSNPNIKLGFDSCCNCGIAFSSKIEGIPCRKCKRVLYCSQRCLKEDTEPSNEYSPSSAANGHSSIICALLRMCNKDEEEEENMAYPHKQKKRVNNVTVGKKEEEARDRIRSEFESYPATLANIIMDGPCYQKVLRKKGNRDKRHKSNEMGNNLIIHIIGASEDAELLNTTTWDQNGGDMNNVIDSYAEALTDLVETFSIPSIYLVFVGPSCPSKNIQKTKVFSISSKTFKSRLHFYTYASMYNESFLKSLSGDEQSLPFSKPDIVVFFNPGFTCPDYNWEETLSCLPGRQKKGTPFLITTNTEMEAIVDCQYLLQRKCITSLPPMIQAMVDTENGQEGDEIGYSLDKDHGGEDIEDNDNINSDANDMFFSENPFAGSRVRQSGTMANDVFVKSMWVFGGNSLSRMEKESNHEIKKRTHVGGEDSPVKKKKAKKKHEVVGKGNSKKSNPALI